MDTMTETMTATALAEGYAQLAADLTAEGEAHRIAEERSVLLDALANAIPPTVPREAELLALLASAAVAADPSAYLNVARGTSVVHMFDHNSGESLIRGVRDARHREYAHGGPLGRMFLPSPGCLAEMAASAESARARAAESERQSRALAERTAAEAQAEALAEARKSAQLSEVLRDHGTPDQRDAWADGLLTSKEAVAVARRVFLLEPLEVVGFNVSEERADIFGESEKVEDVTRVSTAAYLARKKVLAAIPSATLELERLTWTDPEQWEGAGMRKAYTALVRVVVGELTLTGRVILAE